MRTDWPDFKQSFIEVAEKKLTLVSLEGKTITFAGLEALLSYSQMKLKYGSLINWCLDSPLVNRSFTASIPSWF